MAITRSTVQACRALWVELTPGWNARIAECQKDLEHAVTMEQVRALQAEIHAMRAFHGIPDRLERDLDLEDEAHRIAKEDEERRR
jgi:hypothetical protein